MYIHTVFPQVEDYIKAAGLYYKLTMGSLIIHKCMILFLCQGAFILYQLLLVVKLVVTVITVNNVYGMYVFKQD